MLGYLIISKVINIIAGTTIHNLEIIKMLI